MYEEVSKLIIEYKETKRIMEKYISQFDNKDYIQGKIDLVQCIIYDLEKLKDSYK